MSLININYFSVNIRELELLISIITFAVATFIGILIFTQNSRSWTHRLFAILVLVFDAYIVVNYLSLHPPQALISSQFFWIRMVMFVCSFIGPTLLLFVLTFPRDNINIKPAYLLSVITLAVVTAIASIRSLIFESLTIVNGSPLPLPGPAMPLFFIDFIGLVILSFLVLVMKYRKADDKEKNGIFYLLMGVLVSFSLIGVSTVIFVVILKSATLVFLGPIFFVILIGSIAYAIVQYQLFEIKIIATQVLVIMIWLILSAKLFVARTLLEIVIDSFILVLLIVFGIFLIKSVRKEVEQREKLEILSKQLGEANEKLKELDHLKSEFLSFASHQIKAPLAAIKGFATFIYDGTYGPASEKITEAAHKIKDSADRMVNLVSDFLNIRKIEEGRMDYKFEKIDIASMVKNIFEELKPLAQNKKLDFGLEAVPGGGWINADVQKIRQVFQNLIENSIKYTDSGFVKVKTESYAGNFIFSVSDSGHGISKELLPHLFEEFRREADNKLIEGTGLGLYIAREIVLAHHGEIWVESDGPGKGSKFLVKIPLA